VVVAFDVDSVQVLAARAEHQVGAAFVAQHEDDSEDAPERDIERHGGVKRAAGDAPRPGVRL